jgi:hypothetical protein
VPGQRTSVPEAFSLALLAALDVPGVPGLQVDAGLMNVLGRANPSPAPGDTAPISELPEAPRTLRLSVRFSR